MGSAEPLDPELVRTPMDRSQRASREKLAGQGRGRAPGQPAVWMLSEVVDALEPEPIYGRFARGFLDRVLRDLAVRPAEVLHVCSGAMTRADARGGVRLDLRQKACPDILADGRALPFRSGSFAAVLLDPPYSVEYAETLYGVEYPRPSHLLAEAARVVRPGGAIGILHFIVPRAPYGTRLESVLGVSQGVGYRIRAWTVYRRGQASLYPQGAGS